MSLVLPERGAAAKLCARKLEGMPIGTQRVDATWRAKRVPTSDTGTQRTYWHEPCTWLHGAAQHNSLRGVVRALRLLAPAAADQSQPAYQSFQRVAYNVVVSMVCFCRALHVSMGLVRYYMCCRERSRSSMMK
jgi:hypothetical protein